MSRRSGSGPYAPAVSTPTLDEMICNCVLATSTSGITVTESYPLFTAPFGLKILQFALVFWDGSDVTANDTNFWTIALRRNSAGTESVIASKTTQVSGGVGITKRVSWNYDAITFANNTFAKDDILDIAFTKSASGTAIGPKAVATFRYVPT